MVLPTAGGRSQHGCKEVTEKRRRPSAGVFSSDFLFLYLWRKTLTRFSQRDLLHAQIELRNVVGTPINVLCKNADDLHHVGEVKAFYKGERLNLPELPRVPAELASDKIERLSDWLEKVVHEDVAHLIADNLKGSAKLELQARIATDSALDVAIRKAVTSKASALAADFPKSFGSNQRAKQTKLEDIASNISRGIRGTLRRELKSQEGRIDRAIAAKVAQSLKARVGAGASEEDDLFVSTALGGYVGEDEYAMYRDMARRAVSDAKIDSIHYVYRAQPIACGSCGGGDKKKKSKQKEDAYGDDDYYYKDYYYGRPVYDAYNVFSGRAAYMEDIPSSSSSAAAAVSKEVSLRGARLRKKLYQQQQQVKASLPAPKSAAAAAATPMPPLGPKKGLGRAPPGIPIDAEMPEFVPIKSRVSVSSQKVPSSPQPKAVATRATFVPFERQPAFVKIDNNKQSIDAPLPSFDEMLKRVTSASKNK